VGYFSLSLCLFVRILHVKYDYGNLYFTYSVFFYNTVILKMYLIPVCLFASLHLSCSPVLTLSYSLCIKVIFSCTCVLPSYSITMFAMYRERVKYPWFSLTSHQINIIFIWRHDEHFNKCTPFIILFHLFQLRSLFIFSHRSFVKYLLFGRRRIMIFFTTTLYMTIKWGEVEIEVALYDHTSIILYDTVFLDEK